MDEIILQSKREIAKLTGEFFDAVSFNEGEKPAYQALYQLFIEKALIIKNSSDMPEITSVSQFIAPRQKTFDSGELTSFRETEIAEQTDVFGNVAHRLSTYEKRGIRDGEAFDGRGIISIQLIMTRSGWRMSAMAWDDERPGLTIPKRYT
jgi:hypothetical protein